jgi:hypothetical protein
MTLRRFPSAQRLSLAITLLAVSIACDASARSGDAADTPAVAPASAAGTVDSALPVAELLARFRATVLDTPTALGGGAPSADDLARALLRAVSANDTATVRALLVSRAEFAWLYYPHSWFTAPPYELGPELVWFTTVSASDKGAGRLLARYGGRALRFERLLCADSSEVEGPNMVQRGCRVRFAVADSAPRELQLFGALLRRDARYKFLSYANDL